MLEIKNKKLWIIKHIGITLGIIALLSIPIQLNYPQIFPYNLIIVVVGIVLQIIDWKEPFWFSIKRPT